jgi:serine/threonine protein kinase
VTTSSKRQPIPFGKYLLLDRINIGGMAEVWRGKQVGASGFERLVAIKRILPNIAEDAEFITMFIDEAKITVQLTHANIAQVYELGHIQTSYFIAMEYIAGKDMRAIFDRGRKKGEPAPVPLTCYVVGKLCEGLDYAHRKKDGMGRDMNIVHRDISPQNILISYEGEVKVIDFGIAKAAGKATKTQAGILKGKFAYMSPEQIRGLPLDRRSDVFAIGVCLYEMLTGERLFVGDSDFSVLEKVRKAEVTPPSHFNKRVPEALEKIVLKALAKDVEDRYQYASEVADDLQRFLITSDSIFSRKDLMQYMKSTFAEDVEREKLRVQEYADIQAPEGMVAAADSLGLPSLPPAASTASMPVAVPPVLTALPQLAGLPPLENKSGPPVLMPLGAEAAPPTLSMKSSAPVNLVTAPAEGGVRRTPSLTSLPRLTAAAPMLSNRQEDHGAGATVLVDGTPYGGGSPELSTDPNAQPAPPRLFAAQPVRAPTHAEAEATAITTAPSEANKGPGQPPVLRAEPLTVPLRRRESSPESPQPLAPRNTPAEAAAAPAERKVISRERVSMPPRLNSHPAVQAAPTAPMPVASAATTQPGGLFAGMDRRQVLLFGAVGAVAAVLVAAVIILALNRQPAMGWIVVALPAEVEPKAHVNINGHDEDLSKLQNHLLMKLLPIGQAVVLVTADGYEPYTEAVTVHEGQPIPQIRAKLKHSEETTELVVAVEPEQAEIKLDGQVVKHEGDRNGIYVGQIRVGQEVQLEVKRTGFKKFERRVAAAGAGQPVRIPVRLDAWEFPLAVGSDPKGATVSVNGRELGVTPANVTVLGSAAAVVLRKRCYDELQLPLKLPEVPGAAPIPLNGTLRKQPGCH